MFFPRFQFAMDVPAFSFYWFCRQFFKYCDSVSFQIFFILSHPHFFLRDIEWHCVGRVFIVL